MFFLLLGGWYYLYGAVVPSAGVRYYILQTATKSAKVIGASIYNESVVQTASNLPSQQFEFIPVQGKTDTYYIKNASGMYLINSSDVLSLTEYAAEATGTNCEWVMSGTSLTSVRLKVNSSAYLATTDIVDGSYLYCDRTVTDAYGSFKLLPVTEVVKNNLIDPGFEAAVVDGAPLGVWINDAGRVLGNDDAATQSYRSRIVNNGYQSVDNNAFLIRFYGDGNSYTRISHKLTGLTQGASYTFSYKYKQSNTNTSDSKVMTYVTKQSNDATVNALSNVFTSTPPSTTAATQSSQTGSVSFIAPSSDCYVVFAKNSASTNNYMQYLDDMSLVMTSDAVSDIISGVTSFSFSSANRVDTMLITGSKLTDSIRISAPDGVVVNPSVLPPNAGAYPVVVAFKGFYAITDSLVLSSGLVVRKIPLKAVYSTTFISPDLSAKYYLQQRSGGKVMGQKAGTAFAVLRYAEKDDVTQLFRFEAVAGKPNAYYILNEQNKYVSLSASASPVIEFTDKAVNTVVNPRASEWVIQGTADSLAYITRATDASLMIGADTIVDGKLIFTNKLVANVNSAFSLRKASVSVTDYMFDPDFEDNPADGGPLGVWIPSNDPVQLGQYGYSRVQASPWASSGKKCMYLRFLGDATSYNSISHKIFSLEKGATYRLDFQYKVQSTASAATVNIYAATSANADKSQALSGIFSTTVAASSTASGQSPQSSSLTFVAPASTVYIVYSKSSSSTNFNFFVDNLRLTKTTVSAVNEIWSYQTPTVFVQNEHVCVEWNSPVPIETSFELTSADGRTILRQMTFATSGSNRMNVGKLSRRGVYVLRMAAGGSQYVVKFSY